MKGLKKTTKTLSQDSRPLGRDFNLRLPEYEGVLHMTSGLLRYKLPMDDELINSVVFN